MTLPDFVLPPALAQHPIVEKLGWVLLHFLWEGVLVAGALALTLHLLRRRPARERYAVSLAALVFMAVLPVLTWLSLPQEASPASVPASAPAVQAWSFAAGAEGSSALVLQELPAGASASAPERGAAREAGSIEGLAAWGAYWGRQSAPLVALVWLLGVAVLAVRTVGGWGYVLYLRHDATPAAERWQRCFGTLAHDMGLASGTRPPRLLVSGRAEGPAALGWWRPAVLVPTGFLTGLPPDQVEAVLRHELAHIRRHDYLVGLAQAVIETLLFYHPAVWWVSGRVRTLREHCCDDAAVRTTVDRLTYARALAALEDWRSATSFAPAGSGGSLLARIRRITGQGSGRERVMGWPAAAALVVLLGLAACAAGTRTQREAPKDERTAEVVLTQGHEEDTAAPSAPPPAPPVADVRADTIRRPGGRAIRLDTLDHDAREAWQAWAENQEKWAEQWEDWGERWRTEWEEAPEWQAWREQMQHWGDSLGAAFSSPPVASGSLQVFVPDVPQPPAPPSPPKGWFGNPPPAPPPALFDSLRSSLGALDTLSRAFIVRDGRPHFLQLDSLMGAVTGGLDSLFEAADFGRFEEGRLSEELHALSLRDTGGVVHRRARAVERRAFRRAAERLEARAEALEEEGRIEAARALREESRRLRRQHERQMEEHRERLEEHRERREEAEERREEAREHRRSLRREREEQQREEMLQRRREARERQHEVLREQAAEIRERAGEFEQEAEELRARADALVEDDAPETRVEALRRQAEALEEQVLRLRQQSRQLRRRAGRLDRQAEDGDQMVDIE